MRNIDIELTVVAEQRQKRLKGAWDCIDIGRKQSQTFSDKIPTRLHLPHRPSPMRPSERRDGQSFLRRRSGLIFLFFVFVAFTQAGLYAAYRRTYSGIQTDPPDTDSSWTLNSAAFPLSGASKSGIDEHPIPKLMEEAEVQYREKLNRQSKTLGAAVTEYQKRYKRPPPKGFDDWWEFAQKYSVVMVDEFDVLVEDLAPFWAISGEEFRRRSVQVSQARSLICCRV